MSVESAADLAAMFDEDEFAERALYRMMAESDSTECLVIVDRGQGRQPLQSADGDVSTSERKLWAQASQLPTIHRSGLFTMLDNAGAPTGEVFQVAGLPVLDQLGALWSADLLIVS